jgi:O-antigen/teichoic acid export membrane protein
MRSVSLGVKLLRAAAADQRVAYVVVSTGVSLLFLVRSYAAMRALDYAQLGLLAILQTVMTLVAVLHFGLLNGGYRLLCSEPPEMARRLNNLVYGFVVGLAAVSGCAVILLAGTGVLSSSGPTRIVVGFGVAAGVSSLLRTWISNQLIAMEELRFLNRVNITSALASLVPLLWIGEYPLVASVATFVTQPMLFVIVALWLRPPLRPTGLSASADVWSRIVRGGILLFLGGLFLQAITQIERWYVVASLGVDGLGHLYLAIMFVALFQLVPTSLDAVFLPRVVRGRASKDVEAVGRELRLFMLVTFAYCVAAALLLWALGDWVVGLVLPKYLSDLAYVWLILPGLVAFTMSSPFAVVFTAMIRHRIFIIAYGGGALITGLIFFAAEHQDWELGLVVVCAVRSGVLAFMAAVTFVGYLRLIRGDHTLRVRLGG